MSLRGDGQALGRVRRKPRRWRSLATAHPWLVAAAAGVGCAVGLVAADAVFFAGFGLTPWQVGHSPLELLLQAPLLLLVVVAGGTLGNADRVARRLGRPISADTAADLAGGGLILLAMAVGLAWLLAPAQAAWARERVRDGQSVWMHSAWPRSFQVVPARVAGLGGYVPPAAAAGNGARLLAVSPDRYWLYVPATGETIAVPTRQVILITELPRTGGNGP